MPSEKISIKSLSVIFVLIMSAHIWASITSAYFFIWWFDVVMHFAGGFWVAMLALFLIREHSFDNLILLWLVLGLVMLIGVAWEFMEFGLNHFVGGWAERIFYQTNIEDTLGDLIADICGGLVAFILFKVRKKEI
jgi:uncharacterized membrane protein YjdF